MLVAVYVAWLGVDQASVESSFRVAEALADRGELLHAPAGLGFPLLISSVVSLGGYQLTELTLAVLAAGGFVLGALLARRIVPEPYASAGAALAGLSAPAVAYAGVVAPEMTAGVLLAGATLLTVAAREDTRPASVFGAARCSPSCRGSTRATWCPPSRSPSRSTSGAGAGGGRRWA